MMSSVVRWSTRAPVWPHRPGSFLRTHTSWASSSSCGRRRAPSPGSSWSCSATPEPARAPCWSPWSVASCAASSGGRGRASPATVATPTRPSAPSPPVGDGRRGKRRGAGGGGGGEAFSWAPGQICVFIAQTNKKGFESKSLVIYIKLECVALK